MNDEVGRGAERLRARWVPERKLRYYRVLGLEPGVSLEELKQTHKDLVKVWHPDRFADDPRQQQKAEEKLKEINEAVRMPHLDEVLVGLLQFLQRYTRTSSRCGIRTALPTTLDCSRRPRRN